MQTQRFMISRQIGTDMSDIASALTQLAKVRDSESRAALALGVTDICVAKPLSNRAQPLANDILLSLAHKVEESVRVRMAAQLADCEWAPRGIVRYLAFDAPNVAAAIIARSPVLESSDLVELAETGSQQHRVLVAGRQHIGISVSDAAAALKEPDVVDRLVRNTTARLSERTMDICFDIAAGDNELARLMMDREDIPQHLVEKLTAQISAAVRDQVAEHFGLERGKLDDIGTDIAGEPAVIDEETEARKLVERMAAAGELNGTVAVRALTDGKQLLFDYAIADLCGLTVENWRSALGVSSMRATALACRAARIDKSLFPSVVRGMQKAGRILENLPPDAMVSAANIFQKFTPGSAHDALRRLALSV